MFDYRFFSDDAATGMATSASSNPLSPGAIAGIAISTAFLLGGVGFWIYRRFWNNRVVPRSESPETRLDLVEDIPPVNQQPSHLSEERSADGKRVLTRQLTFKDGTTKQLTTAKSVDLERKALMLSRLPT